VSSNATPPTTPEAVRVSEVLGALSFALDLTEGQPMGHALRSCLIGMEVASRLGLTLQESRDLYYALLLKDVGCSSNSARIFELFGGDDRSAQHALKLVDWNNYFRAMQFSVAHTAPGASWFQRARRVASLARRGGSFATELVEIRAHRAGEIVMRLGFGAHVADAVRAIDERWDGGGHPRGAAGSEIPLLARIISLSQVIEVFAMVDGPETALRVAEARSRRWFDPTLVAGLSGMEPLLASWCELDEEGLRAEVQEREPGGAGLLAGRGTFDRIAYGFAEIVDAKSPFTASHSLRVTELALRIAARLGHDEKELIELKRAALLHDIGKLSVPNSILDKPAPLDAEEWETVRLHPYYTQRILEHIRGLERLAFVSASHHERLDGRGYFRGLKGDQIPFGSQVLATADIYDALSTPRPYRPALPEEMALKIMERDRGIGLHGECLDALAEVLEEGAEMGDLPKAA
jgi:HD-GYP domain-containing protein (c-di-GMP phosphodiesterase class II)